MSCSLRVQSENEDLGKKRGTTEQLEWSNLPHEGIFKVLVDWLSTQGFATYRRKLCPSISLHSAEIRAASGRVLVARSRLRYKRASHMSVHSRLWTPSERC